MRMFRFSVLNLFPTSTPPPLFPRPLCRKDTSTRETQRILRYSSLRWAQNILRVGDDVKISTENTDEGGIWEIGRIRDIFALFEDKMHYVEVSWYFVQPLMQNEMGEKNNIKGINANEIGESQLFLDNKYRTVCPIKSIYGKVKVISCGDLNEAKQKYEIFKRKWEENRNGKHGKHRKEYMKFGYTLTSPCTVEEERAFRYFFSFPNNKGARRLFPFSFLFLQLNIAHNIL